MLLRVQNAERDLEDVVRILADGLDDEIDVGGADDLLDLLLRLFLREFVAHPPEKLPGNAIFPGRPPGRRSDYPGQYERPAGLLREIFDVFQQYLRGSAADRAAAQDGDPEIFHGILIL